MPTAAIDIQSAAILRFSVLSGYSNTDYDSLVLNVSQPMQVKEDEQEEEEEDDATEE